MKALAPLGAAAVIYALWRLWMLGNFGGYGIETTWRTWLFLPKTALELIGLQGPVVAAGIVALAVAVFAGAPNWGRALIVLGCLVIVAPLGPIGNLKAVRYGFLPALGVAVLGGMALEHIIRNNFRSRIFRVLTAISLLALILPSLGNLAVWRPQYRAGLEKSVAEGRHVLEAEGQDLIVEPTPYPVFFRGLGWLRESISGYPPGPRPLFDSRILLDLRTGLSATAYDPGAGALTADNSLERRRKNLLERLRPNKPLRVAIRYKEPEISWRVGPYREGRYAIVTEEYYQYVLPIAPTGRVPIKLVEPLPFRIRYTSPEGWVTYSDLLTIAPDKAHAEIMWARPGQDSLP